MEELGELGDVRHVKRDHVAWPEPARRKPAGDPRDAVGELAVGETPPGRGVDQRGPGLVLVGTLEDERGEIGLGNLDIAVRRAVDAGLARSRAPRPIVACHCQLDGAGVARAS